MSVSNISGLTRWIPKLHAPPEWGIEPVQREYRSLEFLDYFVLWGDLGIGLLVLLAGSFLVPGLGFTQAVVAIVIGSAIGCLLLALTGMIGSETAVPTMVLLRPALGIRGSYLPTALNVLQLVGWTIFEIIIMGYAANAISQALFGFSSYPVWAAIFTAIVILMGVGGPLAVVRQWLKKFAVWVVLLTTAWLTYHIFTTYDIRTILQQPGDGSLPFWVAVDIVIAMPVSWLPLVADYNRFARTTGQSFWGTYLGYFVTNVWFYSLGALVLLAAGVAQEPKGFATAIVMTAGWLALLILLVDETDNAWADLYSAAVSVQNVYPWLRQRWLILGLGVVSFLIATALDITQYEGFLLLLGSVFVPLFGVLAADYFVLRQRQYAAGDLYREGGPYWYGQGIHGRGIVAWLVGVVVYQVMNPVTLGAFIPDWPALIPASLSTWGGSIPSFVAAFVVYWLLVKLWATLSPRPAA